jgi:hypothetical protein
MERTFLGVVMQFSPVNFSSVLEGLLSYSQSSQTVHRKMPSSSGAL